ALAQPPGGFGPGAGARGPAAARPDPQPSEAARELPLGPLAPGHLVQGRRGGQVLEAHRPGRALGQPRPPARPPTGPLRPCGRPGRLTLWLLGEDDHLVVASYD